MKKKPGKFGDLKILIEKQIILENVKTLQQLENETRTKEDLTSPVSSASINVVEKKNK